MRRSEKQIQDQEVLGQLLEEKRRALELLMRKYAGGEFDFDDKEIGGVAIIEIRLEQVSGKQA